ncbi:uncharacterized protein MONOS_7458 [Monocercomonoides exilis]|uniref:uncharacterized protein n=1 Tax=Monocercomonoides exilis TaxID=2049356 RepID=UPI003559C73D|nr:hypothetical protein MONOS_7458 [Monocercomonoides exilis]|eukprot:MONOS_7458.1-p1 / transcript=MONOS_7458.1 / gene=MONOS_7458 / organism=Monocercomonoides_exilis_PA203 / gene_product=unspecified product / transcript_product=unspecified product / location=Mono_scaffold00255:41834-44605(+) / protein_length=924 / sequence_SO=supercontig / SO=protein_coding / is_pseudo=false
MVLFHSFVAPLPEKLPEFCKLFENVHPEIYDIEELLFASKFTEWKFSEDNTNKFLDRVFFHCLWDNCLRFIKSNIKHSEGDCSQVKSAPPFDWRLEEEILKDEEYSFADSRKFLSASKMSPFLLQIESRRILRMMMMSSESESGFQNIKNDKQNDSALLHSHDENKNISFMALLWGKNKQKTEETQRIEASLLNEYESSFPAKSLVKEYLEQSHTEEEDVFFERFDDDSMSEEKEEDYDSNNEQCQKNEQKAETKHEVIEKSNKHKKDNQSDNETSEEQSLFLDSSKQAVDEEASEESNKVCPSEENEEVSENSESEKDFEEDYENDSSQSSKKETLFHDAEYEAFKIGYIFLCLAQGLLFAETHRGYQQIDPSLNEQRIPLSVTEEMFPCPALLQNPFEVKKYLLPHHSSILTCGTAPGKNYPFLITYAQRAKRDVFELLRIEYKEELPSSCENVNETVDMDVDVADPEPQKTEEQKEPRAIVNECKLDSGIYIPPTFSSAPFSPSYYPVSEATNSFSFAQPSFNMMQTLNWLFQRRIRDHSLFLKVMQQKKEKEAQNKKLLKQTNFEQHSPEKLEFSSAAEQVKVNCQRSSQPHTAQAPALSSTASPSHIRSPITYLCFRPVLQDLIDGVTPPHKRKKASEATLQPDSQNTVQSRYMTAAGFYPFANAMMPFPCCPPFSLFPQRNVNSFQPIDPLLMNPATAASFNCQPWNFCSTSNVPSLPHIPFAGQSINNPMMKCSTPQSQSFKGMLPSSPFVFVPQQQSFNSTFSQNFNPASKSPNAGFTQSLQNPISFASPPFTNTQQPIFTPQPPSFPQMPLMQQNFSDYDRTTPQVNPYFTPFNSIPYQSFQYPQDQSFLHTDTQMKQMPSSGAFPCNLPYSKPSNFQSSIQNSMLSDATHHKHTEAHRHVIELDSDSTSDEDQ